MIRENDTINGTYQIIKQIGKGGTGIIFLAEHLHLRKKVVLKKIKSNVRNRVNVRKEADILKSLHHTYLPQVYDFFEYESEVYTVIDYINGYDFEKHLQYGSRFEEDQLIIWMIQMCDVLSYLHRHKPTILHNDIKPGNVIVNGDGDICLIDFNISTDISDTMCGFTMEYASPEQYYNYLSFIKPEYKGLNVPITPQSDLYSMGALFYSVASHQSINVEKVVKGVQPLFSQLHTNYSEGFSQVIDRLMCLDANKRYGSAEKVKNDLLKLKHRDARFKKYWLFQICSLFISCVIITSGILLTFKGYRDIKINDFKNDYSVLSAYYDIASYDNTIKKGLEILSNGSYMDFIDREDKAQLNYYIGMAYSGTYEYSIAENYLRKSVALSNDTQRRGIYEMEYAIIISNLGYYEQAQEVLSQAKNDGLNDLYMEYVNAQINYINKNYKDVIDRFNTVKFLPNQKNTYYRFLELTGDAYSETGDWNNAVDSYEKAYAEDKKS